MHFTKRNRVLARSVLVLLAVVVVSLMTTGCAASNEGDQTPKSTATQPSQPQELLTPEALEPSAVPEPVAEEAAAPAEPERTEPKPIFLTGRGSTASKKFRLVGEMTYFKSVCRGGESNFVVTLINASTGEETIIANEIGRASTTRVEFPDAGTYLLEVESDSSWSVRITQPVLGEVPETKKWTGKGTQATAAFYMEPGVKTFTFGNKGGDSNFVVEIYGAADDIIANEIGPARGSSVVTVEEGGGAVIQVESDGNWTVSYE